MKPTALVLCARSDPRHGDAVASDTSTAVERHCASCGEALLVAPNTVRMESTYAVDYRCNPCGNLEVAAVGVRSLGIAPGALPPTTPENRRRRSELEAHGFTDLPEVGA